MNSNNLKRVKHSHSVSLYVLADRSSGFASADFLFNSSDSSHETTAFSIFPANSYVKGKLFSPRRRTHDYSQRKLLCGCARVCCVCICVRACVCVGSLVTDKLLTDLR